ncbi:MAG: GntR family transcriptional regulator [Paracoccaceae bacterium]|nr:GntR family transcriptional regulator [Paracoccaceae bacterium]
MDVNSHKTVSDRDVTAVAEWVADILRDRIVKGVLPSGARIVERKLSSELNVSRTPIREALKLLRADNLIEISRHKGAQVTEYAPQQALDMFDVIASLESLAAERLANVISPEDLHTLESLHAQMLAHYDKSEAEAYFDVNSAIHDAILSMCGNPVLQETHVKLMARARRGRFMAIMDPDRLNEAVSEHEKLMVALRRRDSEAARQVWRSHLLNTGRTVATVLSAET